jgi:hypothetical protein
MQDRARNKTYFFKAKIYIFIKSSCLVGKKVITLKDRRLKNGKKKHIQITHAKSNPNKGN